MHQYTLAYAAPSEAFRQRFLQPLVDAESFGAGTAGCRIDKPRAADMTAIFKQGLHSYLPVGRCIYCGSTIGRLSNEHIVPYGLDGNLILPEASCESCRLITEKYEAACLKTTFKPLRTRLGMKSRRPREDRVEVELRNHDGSSTTTWFHHKDFPVAAFGMYLPIAGIVQGKPPTDTVDAKLLLRFHEGELERFVGDVSGIARIGSFDPTSFMRMLAKIGYAYAVAELRDVPLHPMLPDLVLAREPNASFLPYLVGGDEKPAQAQNFHNRLLLSDYTIGDRIYTAVEIQLFASLGMPKYHVIVRERQKPGQT